MREREKRARKRESAPARCRREPLASWSTKPKVLCTLRFAFFSPSNLSPSFQLVHFLLLSSLRLKARHCSSPSSLPVFLSAYFRKSRWRGTCLCLPPERRKRAPKAWLRETESGFLLSFQKNHRSIERLKCRAFSAFWAWPLPRRGPPLLGTSPRHETGPRRSSLLPSFDESMASCW